MALKERERRVFSGGGCLWEQESVNAGDEK